MSPRSVTRNLQLSSAVRPQVGHVCVKRTFLIELADLSADLHSLKVKNT